VDAVFLSCASLVDAFLIATRTARYGSAWSYAMGCSTHVLTKASRAMWHELATACFDQRKGGIPTKGRPSTTDPNPNLTVTKPVYVKTNRKNTVGLAM